MEKPRPRRSDKSASESRDPKLTRELPPATIGQGTDDKRHIQLEPGSVSGEKLRNQEGI